MTRHIYDAQELDELSRQTRKIHKINEDIALHLFGSIIQLLKYGEKYSVKIPKKGQLEQILLNSKFLLEEHKELVNEFNSTIEYFNSHQPKGNSDKNNLRGTSTRIMVLSSLCRNLQV